VKSVFRGVAYAALTVLLGLVAWLHLVNRITLVTADLGRHIRNGELAWVEHHLITTNYYSLTNADFPTICHHWGAGVAYYLVWRAFGFIGLSVFQGGLLLVTLAIFVWIAARAGALRSALLATALALPLIGTRIEVRPEGFSALFVALSFLLLYGERSNWFPRRWLWLLVLLQLLWVNVHILFPLGFVLLGIFLVDAIIVEGFAARFKLLAFVLIAALIASLLNPSGVAGLIEPLRLVRAQEYKSLIENQTIFWTIQGFPAAFVYRYSLGLIGVAGILVIAHLAAERNLRRAFLPVVIFAWFAMMAIQGVRSIALFGMVFIPVAAVSWERTLAVLGDRWRRLLQIATAFAAATAIGAAAVLPGFFLSPLWRFASAVAESGKSVSLPDVLSTPELWSGLTPGTEGSARFFKKAGLHGPVFNNYDIGGYLIFHLFPQERPFIDNRPEAYPKDFALSVYGAMQADNNVWAVKAKELDFQVIFFYRLDMTEWGQRFLVQRISDPEWAPIFVDGYTLIMARRGGPNQAIIDLHELPREMFGVRRSS